jgi:hypothetical protein
MNPSEIKNYGSVDAVFVLCDTCHWCATYFDKSSVPNYRCPICGNTAISTFPILPNEEFTFDYTEKRGVELEFDVRRNKDMGKGKG